MQTSAHRRCRMIDQLLKVGMKESQHAARALAGNGNGKSVSTADRRRQADAAQQGARWRQPSNCIGSAMWRPKGLP